MSFLCAPLRSPRLCVRFSLLDSQMLNVRAALKNGIAQLREADVPSFTLAAELLLLHVLRRNRAWLYAHPEEIIAHADVQRFFELVVRRTAGEPTQHLTGKQEFWGLEFEVTPDVLIPRPETEHVIEVALDRLALRELRAGRPQKSAGSGLQIADIGTGSGCIAIALAKELPAANFLATDLSPAALAVALRNAQRHAVADRIHFIECNLLAFPVGAQHAAPLLGTMPNSAPPVFHESPVTGHASRPFDLIASNPPYIGRREASSLPRNPRPRTRLRPLRRRRRLRTLRQLNRPICNASEARRSPRPRARPQFPARRAAPPRRSKLDQRRRNQRPRRHPPRPRRRTLLTLPNLWRTKSEKRRLGACRNWLASALFTVLSMSRCCRASLRSSTSTWTRFSSPWNCSSVRNCAANL